MSGPFTAESLSPHRILPTDEAAGDAMLEAIEAEAEEAGRPHSEADGGQDFVRSVMDNLKKAGSRTPRRASGWS